MSAEPIAVCAALREATYGHLARVWFDGVCADQRAALLRTCLFPAVEFAAFDDEPDLVRALRGLRGHAALVAPVSRHQLRYHDLFRTFLIRELRLAGSTAFHRTVLDTAARLERCGETEDAVVLLAEAGDAEALRALLGRCGRELAGDGAFDSLERALRAIPDGMRRTDAVCVRLLGEIRSTRDSGQHGGERQGHPAGDGTASTNDDGEHRPDGFAHAPRHGRDSRFRRTI
jgi:hypothetical protein